MSLSPTPGGTTRIGSSSDLPNALGLDVRSLGALKLQAGKATPAAIKETAKQFESLFMRELIKSMREATMKSGLTDSPGGDLGTDLLDQQLALQMSGRPGGLSDLIAAQLTRQMAGSDSNLPSAAKPVSAASPGASPSASPGPLPVGPAGPVSATQAAFVQRHTQAAEQVAKASGIPASFMLGQAGHETGWGQREIKTSNGANSFNLFGIKATSAWAGPVAEVTTTEYVAGVAHKTTAKFRAYSSYDESFRDYGRLITQSPRYAHASQQTGSVQGYANGLQQAGYATDPQYAAKLSRAINSALHMQRAQA